MHLLLPYYVLGVKLMAAKKSRVYQIHQRCVQVIRFLVKCHVLLFHDNREL